MMILKWIVIVVVAAYLGAVALLYVTQRSLMYFPDRSRVSPAAAGLRPNGGFKNCHGTKSFRR